MPLEIDSALLNTYLSGALTFINNYKRDTYPLVISTRNLLPNSFHAVEGRRNYFPGSKVVGCATSEAMTSFARACFYAWEVTGNLSWKNLGLDVIQSFTDYFFIETIPSTTQIWDSHWLCIAFGSTPTKGAQPNTTPATDAFNYGNFDTNVTFTNGIGTLGTNSSLADVFKVYAGDLKYLNVYAPLLEGGIEYGIEYWVSNYSLEGINFRIYPDGTRSQTSDAIGTIKLTTNFSGTAKVAWADYSGGTISSPTSPRQGQGLIEPYPFWNGCSKPGGRTILNTAFDTYWWGVDAFELAYKNTNNIAWDNAAKSFKYTAQQAMLIENLSFYNKKEDTSYPFRYPGSQAFTTNNETNTKPTLSASRDTSNNYLVLSMGTPVANSYPTMEFQNFVVQTQLDDNVSIFAEASINVSTILEIKLSTAQDLFDTSEEYIAYWNVLGDNVSRNITLNLNNFIRWGNTICWHPKIAEDPIFTYSGLGGSISQRINQDFNFGINTRPLFLEVNLSKNNGFAGFGLNNCNFNNTPPTIRYSLNGDVSLRVQDSNNAYWYCQLPSRGDGEFLTFIGDWSQFTGSGSPGSGNIKEVVFEINNGNARIIFHYLANDVNYIPETVPISKTVYKASLVSKVRAAHTLRIGTFRPINNKLDRIPYFPGAVPFTRNTVRIPKAGGGYETVVDSWGQGMLYMGYLSPYHQHVWGNIQARDNQIAILSDSFTAYTNQSTSQIRGLPQQVFLAALWDSAAFATYGEKLPPIVKKIMGFVLPFLFDKTTTVDSNVYKLNTFSWRGSDPNTAWFPYAARVMESTARYIYVNPGDTKAKALINQYLQFLLDDYKFRGSIAPLTDIVPQTRPQSNYNEPHAAALIGRCALYANLAGLNAKLTTDILDICYRYLISQYVSSGNMLGSFAAGQPNFTHNSITYKEYFPFWHGEIIEFIALLIKYKDFIIYPTLSTPGIYPSIEPTKITNIKESTFKGSLFRFSDGNRQNLLNRKSQTNKEITFEYFNVTESELEIFTDFYKTHGTSELFALPDDVPLLQKYRLYGTTLLYWRLAKPISFQTVVANSNRGVFKFAITIVCD
jgi:hypothetical protein